MKIPTDNGLTSNHHAIIEDGKLFGQLRKKQTAHEFAYTAKQGAPTPVNADAAIRTQGTLFERTQARRMALKHGENYRPYVKTDAAMQPCNPVTLQSKSTVAGSLGCRVTKRYPVTVADKVTGEPVEVMAKLITYSVIVKTFGKVFTFSTSNRAKGTFLDSRDDSRHPLSFAQSELVRLLGADKGAAQFRILTGATEPSLEPVIVSYPATLPITTELTAAQRQAAAVARVHARRAERLHGCRAAEAQSTASEVVTKLTRKARKLLRESKHRGGRRIKPTNFCGPRLDTTRATAAAAEAFDAICRRS